MSRARANTGVGNVCQSRASVGVGRRFSPLFLPAACLTDTLANLTPYSTTPVSLQLALSPSKNPTFPQSL